MDELITLGLGGLAGSIFLTIAICLRNHFAHLRALARRAEMRRQEAEMHAPRESATARPARRGIGLAAHA